MGYDNPLQNEYEGFRQRASRIEGDWCDDCHGYTHMPWCSEYEEPIVILGGKYASEYEPVSSSERPASDDHNQQHAAQLCFLGNRAEELSSLLAGMTTERDEMREALSDMLTIVEDEGHVSSYLPQVTAARKILAETALTAAAAKKGH